MRAYALRVYTSTCVRYKALPITEVSLVHDDQFDTGFHWWRMSEPHTSAAATRATIGEGKHVGGPPPRDRCVEGPICSRDACLCMLGCGRG
jgi:hypothetical protein